MQFMAIGLQLDWNLIRECYNNGMPIKEIAREFGVKHGTIAARASRGNWRNTLTKANTISQSVQVQVLGKEQDSPALSKQSEAAKAGLADLLARSIEKIQSMSIPTPKAALKVNQELESVVRNCKGVFGWSEGQSSPAVRIQIMDSTVVVSEDKPQPLPTIEVESKVELLPEPKPKP